VLGLLLAASLAHACASTALSDEQLKHQLRLAAASVPGLPDDYAVVAVNAESEMDAWARVAQATGEGPSPLARQIGHGFARAEKKAVTCVIGGPYEQLVERVLIDAFSLVHAARLPGLSLLVVTPEPPGDEVVAAARKLGVRLTHRPLPTSGG
jgi:hypothetical protein